MSSPSSSATVGSGPERQPRVLVIDDELTMREFLEMGLGYEGFEVRTSGDGLEGLETAHAWGPDLVILDRMLPSLDGLEVCRRLRAGGEVGVLMLTARGDVDDRVEGLEAGADDYLPKPYAFSELLARVEALARRRQPGEVETVYRTGDLELDRLRHTVTRSGKPVPLQPREFRLLEYLMKHAGQVVTRTMLLENVWDYHFDPQTNVIDVHISRLRSKIDKGFERPLLHTIRGAGYMIRDGIR